MRRIDKHLDKASLGTKRELVSFHFGDPGARPKVYVQAGLHAGEQPGVLVARKLVDRLSLLEAEGHLRGEIVVVPVANPIGLDQHMLGVHQGRFDAATGDNFNRHFPDLATLIADDVGAFLGQDEAANVAVIRHGLAEALAAVDPRTETEALRLALLGLAIDADMVLDMHCDSEALVHLYAHSRQLEDAELLGRHIGARAILHAELQSGDSFDEACMSPWAALAARWPESAIPMACFGVTIEWRGMGDVDDATAQADCDHVLDFLRARGVLEGDAGALPRALCAPTPLAATDILRAPVPGTIVFRADLGTSVEEGDVIVDIVDPIEGTVHSLAAACAGVLYARERQRFAMPDMELAYVAGAQIRRSGGLLSR
jgi:hypothetical protein